MYIHLDLSQNQLDGEAVDVLVKAALRSLQVFVDLCSGP